MFDVRLSLRDAFTTARGQMRDAQADIARANAGNGLERSADLAMARTARAATCRSARTLGAALLSETFYSLCTTLRRRPIWRGREAAGPADRTQSEVAVVNPLLFVMLGGWGMLCGGVAASFR